MNKALWQKTRERLPRPETVLLLLAFLCTVGVKLAVVRQHDPDNLLEAWIHVIASDAAFFAALATAISGAYVARPGGLSARLAMLVGLTALAWALANAGWVVVTGIQLQPGIVSAIMHHPAEFWPTVRPHVVKHPLFAAGVGACGLAGIALSIWRVVRPLKLVAKRRTQITKLAAWTCVFAICGGAHLWGLPRGGLAFSGQVLNYSSHWYAFESLFVSGSNHNKSGPGRAIPRVGERTVGLPPAESPKQPNVVLLLLESVSHAATGMGDPDRHSMPVLERLAAEGVEFVNTRVPVSQTGKAFWAILSGTTPDIHPDYSEAILADEPYEGLPSILKRSGYRSAFFQMARGSFQCAPATFANFEFDWAWFRENLEDPGANLGYLGGDDFRMLDPACEWIASGDEPFLLMMITSASHSPYEVPAWFEPPEEGEYNRFIQTIRYTDAFIGEVLERLRKMGIGDNTLVCILGDHGDSHRPDAQHSRWVPYEEVIRVPWVIHWPGHGTAGARVEPPVSQMDVTPTILSLLGYDISAAGFDGVNAMASPGGPRRMYFSSWFEGSPVGYTEGLQKWVYWPRTGEVFEFDLATDPDEKSPMAVTGAEQQRVIADVLKWQRDSHLVFGAKRFRKSFLFDHWVAFSSGRYGRAYYVP